MPSAALDRGSLQHHGEAALRLVRRFASMDLGSLQARDAVYFSLPLLGVAPHYSTLWAVPFAAAATVLFVIAVVRARRRREASIGGVILAAFVFAAFAGASGYLGWRYGRLAAQLHARWLPEGNVLMSGAYAAAMVALIVTVWLAFYVLLRKKFAADSIALGSLAVWVIAALLSSWFVAGASFVAVWPLVGGVLMTAAASAERSDASPGAGRVLTVMLLAVPAILIVCPLVDALFYTMGLAPESGAAMAGLTALALGAVAVPTEFVVERRRWWPAGVALVAALSFLAVAVSETRYSNHHPKRVNLYYVMDADAQKASWAAKVDRTDAWTSQFLGASPKKGRPPALVAPWSTIDGVPGFLSADAPAVSLPAPQAVLVNAVPTEGGRNVTIRATPGREGDELSVWVNGVPALDVSVDGKRIAGMPAQRAPDDTSWTLNYMNAPASGATVSLTLKGSQRLTVAVVERSFGLPAVPDRAYTRRPASLMPVQDGDLTIVRRTYTF